MEEGSRFPSKNPAECWSDGKNGTDGKNGRPSQGRRIYPILGTAGTIGTSLVVNLAGSPGACRDGYAVLKPALGHALRLLADQLTATDHVHT